MEAGQPWRLNLVSSGSDLATSGAAGAAAGICELVPRTATDQGLSGLLGAGAGAVTVLRSGWRSAVPVSLIVGRGRSSSLRGHSALCTRMRYESAEDRGRSSLQEDATDLGEDVHRRQQRRQCPVILVRSVQSPLKTPFDGSFLLVVSPESSRSSKSSWTVGRRDREMLVKLP